MCFILLSGEGPTGILKGQTHCEDLVDLLIEGKVDFKKINMPSFNQFKDDLENATA